MKPRTRRKIPRRIPAQARSKETVAIILRAAAQVLVEAAPDQVSTNLIAKVAGISVGSLYQYFPDKGAIFAALVAERVERTGRIIGGRALALLGTPLPDAVRGLVRAQFESYQDAPELGLALFEQITRSPALQRLLIASYDSIIALVTMCLRAYTKELRVKDLDRASYLLVHAVDGMLFATVLLRREYLHDERFISETADMALRYLVDS